MIYLYGVLSADAAVDGFDLSTLTGVTGPVALAQTRQGYLIHGPAPEGDILPKRRFLLAHAKVLEAMNALGTLLPMRFGMSAPSLGQVSTMLDAEQAAILNSFQHLEGAVELGLRISFPRQAALEAILAEDAVLRAERDRLSRHRKPPHFETADLGRRLAEALGRRRDRAQKGLLGQIVPLCRDHVLRAPEEDAHVLNVDVLIDRAAQESFADSIESIARACPFAPGAEPDIRLVGPAPAYNFVRLMLSADQGQAA